MAEEHLFMQSFTDSFIQPADAEWVSGVLDSTLGRGVPVELGGVFYPQGVHSLQGRQEHQQQL